MMRKLLIAMTLGAIGLPAAAQPSHTDQIQALASIAAMAQTASDRCPDILVNNTMLSKARTFFEVTPDDQQAYRLAIDLEMKRLAATINAAPSPKVWCDEAYRAYGPEGDAAKGLLAR